METNDINIKILCQNIANNPKDFDASTLEIWFNRFAYQEHKELSKGKVIVNGIHRIDEKALGLLDVNNSVCEKCKGKGYVYIKHNGAKIMKVCHHCK